MSCNICHKQSTNELEICNHPNYCCAFKSCNETIGECLANRIDKLEETQAEILRELRNSRVRGWGEEYSYTLSYQYGNSKEIEIIFDPDLEIPPGGLAGVEIHGCTNSVQVRSIDFESSGGKFRLYDYKIEIIGNDTLKIVPSAILPFPEVFTVTFDDYVDIESYAYYIYFMER